ncbi:hypothetical protein I5U42_18970 [Stenotrophomonas maltophilia]|nr:hypothetical protein [Stenotrophomonas maltophilia]
MDVTMRFGLMLFSWVIAAPVLAGECQFDNRAELLAMPPDAFNQGPGEGWDALVERAGCQLELADLFAAYRRQAKASGPPELAWHEAQLRLRGATRSRQRADAVDVQACRRRPGGLEPLRGCDHRLSG